MQSTSSYQCPPPNTDPGPTVIVQEPGQVPANNAYALSERRRGYSDMFNGQAGLVTGVVQIWCGIVACSIGIAQFAIDINSSAGWIGSGIWSGGLFFIPCGIIGIFTVRKRTSLIIAYMVMCNLSAFVANYLLIAGSVFTLEVLYNFEISIDPFLPAIGLIEMVTAIVALCYCCLGVCRFNTSTTTMPGVTERSPLIHPQGAQVPTAPTSVQADPYYTPSTQLYGS